MKGQRQTWDVVDPKVMQRNILSSRKTPASERGVGVFVADWGQKVRERPPQRKSSTHGVYDALQRLEAIIHWKHVILTVCNPGQLRTQQTHESHGAMSGEDVENLGKLLG